MWRLEIGTEVDGKQKNGVYIKTFVPAEFTSSYKKNVFKI